MICISLMISNIDHLLMCLLATCLSSKCLFRSSVYILNWIICFFFYWPVGVIYLLWILLLLFIPFANTFSHSVGCLLVLLMGIFCCAKAFKFNYGLFGFFVFCGFLCFYFFCLRKMIQENSYSLYLRLFCLSSLLVTSWF